MTTNLVITKVIVGLLNAVELLLLWEYKAVQQKACFTLICGECMILAYSPKPQNGAPNPLAINSHSFTTLFSFPFSSLLFPSFPPSSLPLMLPNIPWNRSTFPLYGIKNKRVKEFLWFLQGYTISSSKIRSRCRRFRCLEMNSSLQLSFYQFHFSLFTSILSLWSDR